MAATFSTMIELGVKAPEFSLLEPASGEVKSLEELRGEHGTLVAFICNHCPYVKHVAHELAAMGAEYSRKGVSMVAINANDADTYPSDSPEKMIEEVAQRGYTFPYLYDETQETAQAYHATCTPDYFLFDSNLNLVYRGQLDDSRPGNDIPVTGKDLRQAIESLIAKKPISPDQKPSIGCNIKWRSNL